MILHFTSPHSFLHSPAAGPVALEGRPGMGVRRWLVFSALAPDDTISFSSCFFDTVSVASSVYIELLPPPTVKIYNLCNSSAMECAEFFHTSLCSSVVSVVDIEMMSSPHSFFHSPAAWSV